MSNSQGDDDAVVFVCAVSAAVNKSLLPEEIVRAPQIEIRPVNAVPNPELISHEHSLRNFSVQWLAALAAAESHYPNARRWHLVAAVPISVAIEAGRAIMRDAHPPVTVYHRHRDSYEGVLVINGQ
jgi:hypothetical protein